MTTATKARESELTYGYFGHIAKFDKLDDGTLMVYGKAVGPDIDLDQQICDPTWLKSAMPKWFEWGNVREQHNNIAAGVGIEMTEGDDGSYWLKSHVVDPGTVKKIETRVLKGYSVGIQNGRVIRDKAARGGRINDGDIAEISLVDRPSNATCSISIAKSADGVTFYPTEVPQVGDVDEDGSEVVAVIDLPEMAEKSAGWYRGALRTVEDALAYRWQLPLDAAGRVIAKAAGEGGADEENADVAAAYAAMDQILDLIVAEAQQAKGGRIKELRDIEVLLQACRSLCCFIECEQDEENGGELADHDVIGYESDDDKAYMVKAFGAWGDAVIEGEPDLIKSVSAAARREAKREGDTMPDGSYPITNQDQLDSAVHLAGHSKTYSRTQVLAHIRRQAKKHNLTLPESMSRSTAGGKSAGSASVADVQAEITKAVAAARAESDAAHEAELATLRASLEKAQAAPMSGGPVTFKTVQKTSSAPRQALTPADPEYWRAQAAQPGLDISIQQAYLARAEKAAAASPVRGAST